MSQQPVHDSTIHLLKKSGQCDAGSPANALAWAELAQRISACGRHLRRNMAGCFTELELTDSEFLLLLCCHRSGPEGAPQHEMASAIGLSPAQLSGLVDRLGGRELIVSHRRSDDRRRRYWRLTESGDQVFNTALSRWNLLVQQFEQQISSEQWNSFHHLLDLLTGATAPPPLLRIFNRDVSSQSQNTLADKWAKP